MRQQTKHRMNYWKSIKKYLLFCHQSFIWTKFLRKNTETQLYQTYSADMGGWREYGVDIWIWWNRRLSSTSGTAECLTSLTHCHRRSPCVCHSACGWASSSGLRSPGMFWVKVTWDVASRSVPHYHQKFELVHCLQGRAVGWVMEKDNHQFYSFHTWTVLYVMSRSTLNTKIKVL